MSMFDSYTAELASDLTPEEADVLNEKYRTGLEAIQDFNDEVDADDCE